MVAGTAPAGRGDVHSHNFPSHHGFLELDAYVWGKVCACMGERTANHWPKTKHSSTAEIWELLFKGEGSSEQPGKLFFSIHPVGEGGCYFAVRMTD